jgi:hypothetical protein
MSNHYDQLSLQELYDLLAKDTTRYSEILLHGGLQEEFAALKASIKQLQEEIEKRRPRSSHTNNTN